MLSSDKIVVIIWQLIQIQRAQSEIEKDPTSRNKRYFYTRTVPDCVFRIKQTLDEIQTG